MKTRNIRSRQCNILCCLLLSIFMNQNISQADDSPMYMEPPTGSMFSQATETPSPTSYVQIELVSEPSILPAISASESPTASTTPTMADDTSVWNLREGDSERRLRSFLEVYNRVQSFRFQAPIDANGFATAIDELKVQFYGLIGKDMIDVGRANDIFSSLLSTLVAVGHLESQPLARSQVFEILRNVMKEANYPEEMKRQLFEHFLVFDLGYPGGSEEFCRFYGSAKAALLPQPHPNFELQLSSAAQIMASNYRLGDPQHRPVVCIYSWATSLPIWDPGAVALYSLMRDETQNGNHEFLGVLKDLFLENRDPEVLGYFNNLGLIQAIAMAASPPSVQMVAQGVGGLIQINAVADVIPSVWSKRAAEIIALTGSEGARYWHYLYSGMLNISVTEVSMAHLNALVCVLEDQPELRAQVLETALEDRRIVGKPAAYYTALNTLILRIHP